MASTASTYIANIDTTYPKPGVDNNTQGFRDNFSNIQAALDTMDTYLSGLADATLNIDSPYVTGTYVTADMILNVGGTSITTGTDYTLHVSANGMAGNLAVFPSTVPVSVIASTTGEQLKINGSVENILVGATFTLTGALSTITFNVVQVDIPNSFVYADQAVTQGIYAGYFENPNFPVQYTAVNPTQVASAIDTVLPYGMIMLWYGTVSSIPTGWQLCDGTNNTPNLTNVFVVGANADYNGIATSTVTGQPAITGGSAESTLPAHSHEIDDQGHTHPLNPAGNNTANITAFGGSTQYMGTGAGGFASGLGNTNVAVISTGTDATYGNIPPFQALCYIMKVV